MTETISKTYARAMTIATSDSGGGAGVQADLKTFSALGCFGTSVLAALTAQNTHEVRGIEAMPPDFVSLQIDTVLDDIGTDAVKIGMLFNGKIMEVVAERLKAHNVQKVVLDPVMVAKSGAKLIKDEAIETIKDALFPLSTVITPNLPEAETLLGTNISDQSEMEAAARKLLDLGPHAVLLKGGHFSNQKSVDCLVLNAPDENGNDLYWYKSERIHTKNTHGTGCTLSSAIAAGLAKGMKLPESVQEAKNYITEAIAAGSEYRLGQGHGPLHHFYQSWD